MTQSTNRGTRSLVASLFFLFCVVGIVPSAHADVQQEARRHFDRAIELVDAKDFAAAIVEFNRCYELKPHYTVLYDIGQAYVSLGEPVAAVDALRRYLDEGGHAIDAARLRAVGAEIQRQNAQIATIDVRVEPAGAAIGIDGKTIGAAPLPTGVRVRLGYHTITASLEGYQTAERKLSLNGEDHTTVELLLVAQPLVPPRSPDAPVPTQTVAPAAQPKPTIPENQTPTHGVHPPSQPRADASSWNTLRIAGVASASLGVASLAAGTGAWLVARSKHQDALSLWNANDKESARRTQNDAAHIVSYGNIGLVAGGALLGVGALLYVVGVSSTPPRSNAVAERGFHFDASIDSVNLSVAEAW